MKSQLFHEYAPEDLGGVGVTLWRRAFGIVGWTPMISRSWRAPQFSFHVCIGGRLHSFGIAFVDQDTRGSRHVDPR